MSLSSTHAESRRLMPAALEGRLKGWSGRIAGAVLLSAAVFGWASLLSWSAADPSLTRTNGGDVANWAGIAGAIFSDLTLQTFGLAAAGLLFVPMFWGLELVRGGRVDHAGPRSVFFALAIAGLSGAIAALPVGAPWHAEGGAGGLLGEALFDLCAGFLPLANVKVAALVVGLALGLSSVAALVFAAGINVRDLHRGQRARGGVAISPVEATGLPGWIAQPDDTVRGADRADEFPAATEHAADAVDQFEDVQIADAGIDPLPAFLRRDRVDGERSAGDLRVEGKKVNSSRASTPKQNIRRQGPRVLQKASACGVVPWGESDNARPATPPRQGVAAPTPKRVGQRCAGDRNPIVNLLQAGDARIKRDTFVSGDLRDRGGLLQDVLGDFGIRGEVRDIKPGPVVTLFELEPARGTKSSRVIGLADDIARSMSARSARIAVVPGKNAIGIELPNVSRAPVVLRDVLEDRVYCQSKAALPIALGTSITGEAVVSDLAQMPHLLIAGTTGSGKSVGINAMIVSLLARHRPEDCRMLMIDPKMLELSVYNDIPHLLTPVVTDPHDALAALSWAVGEMEERYKRMSKLSVRNIEAFNARVRAARANGGHVSRTVQTGFDPQSGQPIYEREDIDVEPMPYIVVVVDEFADLMSVAGKEIEAVVQRLAQMARAAGIHLIMATQRPSVDVITGTIKANFPTRISFKVASKVDSRTILNDQGAEQLLGHGDMLYAHGGGPAMRVHGPFVSDDEVERVAGFLRSMGAPRYVAGVTDVERPQANNSAQAAPWGCDDELFERAMIVVRQEKRASTSHFQRRLSIGYNRAANLMQRLEQEGIVTPPNPAGRREIVA